MRPETVKVLLAVLITAVVVGAGVYSYNGSQTQTGKNQETSPAIKSFSKSSNDYAIMGTSVWSAFECSALAAHVDNNTEAERLFEFAYNQGKEFVGAFLAGNITDDDIRAEVPLGVRFLLGGPSEEFILGRIFEGTQESALENVLTTNGSYNSEDIQEIRAQNLYRERNCSLIGR